MTTKTSIRPIFEIAKEIRQDWQKPNYAAVPYLNAMRELVNITDLYGYDSGKSIVSYFLSNAGQWRGDTAKKVKAELNMMLKLK